MKIKRMADFIGPMKEKFPGLDEKTIKRIINQGCHNLAYHIKNEDDVSLNSGHQKVKFLVYQYRDFFEEKKNNV